MNTAKNSINNLDESAKDVQWGGGGKGVITKDHANRLTIMVLLYIKASFTYMEGL